MDEDRIIIKDLLALCDQYGAESGLAHTLSGYIRTNFVSKEEFGELRGYTAELEKMIDQEELDELRRAYP